jgi:hypothetical protein|tara:strand:- start:326 stop:628 length:303 start_codon:yes stop_codon:yes gene_type:complete
VNPYHYELDPPDRTGHRELRLDGGIVCWIQMDDNWDGAEAWLAKLLTMLRRYPVLEESNDWYETHHAKCEDICGAECVPSEDEVSIFQESNHEIKPWREE